MITEEKKQQWLSIPCNNHIKFAAILANAKYNGEEISWQDISDIVYSKFGHMWSRKTYAAKFTPEVVESILSEDDDNNAELLLEIRKERVKLSDELSQTRSYIRRLAREETIKEIALEFAKKMSAKKTLQNNHTDNIIVSGEKEAILLLSDWHYGMEVNSHWNKYNTSIAKERIQTLLDQTLTRCRKENITRIHVLNLGDLIAGRIHLPIRLESRIDVITQVMEVSELLAEFLHCLSCELTEVDYYSCTDNHSRVEPDKTQSLDLESLCRITDWYLKERLMCCNVKIHENDYSEDIITLEVLGHKIIAVHGDRDKPSEAISKLSNFTRDTYEAVLMSHRHHFTADEECGTLVIGNGALMGTDAYAKSLRLHSDPSQTLLFSTKECVIDSIVRIVLK